MAQGHKRAIVNATVVGSFISFIVRHTPYFHFLAVVKRQSARVITFKFGVKVGNISVLMSN